MSAGKMLFHRYSLQLDDDDLEEKKAMEKWKLQESERLSEAMHPVPDVSSDKLPNTFSRRMLFDKRSLTTLVFFCSMASVWICVPMCVFVVTPAQWSSVRHYFKLAKFWDTLNCRDSSKLSV
jgi:hypothetical protein